MAVLRHHGPVYQRHGPSKRIPSEKHCQIPAVSGGLISGKYDSFSPLNFVHLNFVGFILCSIYKHIRLYSFIGMVNIRNMCLDLCFDLS